MRCSLLIGGLSMFAWVVGCGSSSPSTGGTAGASAGGATGSNGAQAGAAGTGIGGSNGGGAGNGSSDANAVSGGAGVAGAGANTASGTAGSSGSAGSVSGGSGGTAGTGSSGAPEVAQTSPLIGMGAVELVRGGFAFVEGARWVPALSSYLLSDPFAVTIYKLTPPSQFDPFRMMSDGANALDLDSTGHLVAAECGAMQCQTKGAVTRRGDDGTWSDAIKDYRGLAIQNPNDIAALPDGSLIFSDPVAPHQLLRIDPQGALSYALPTNTGVDTGLNGIHALAEEGRALRRLQRPASHPGVRRHAQRPHRDAHRRRDDRIVTRRDVRRRGGEPLRRYAGGRSSLRRALRQPLGRHHATRPRDRPRVRVRLRRRRRDDALHLCGLEALPRPPRATRRLLTDAEFTSAGAGENPPTTDRSAPVAGDVGRRSRAAGRAIRRMRFAFARNRWCRRLRRFSWCKTAFSGRSVVYSKTAPF